MSTLTSLISNREAARMIEAALGVNGVYYLANNRRGEPDEWIPCRRINGQVYYDPAQVEAHVRTRKRRK